MKKTILTVIIGAFVLTGVGASTVVAMGSIECRVPDAKQVIVMDSIECSVPDTTKVFA